MTFLNIPDKRISDKSDNEITYDFNLTVITLNDRVKFSIGDVETSFMDVNDRFIDRIQFEKLNSCFLAEHIEKEIEIKNLLDDAVGHVSHERFSKAVELLDEVIYYDGDYGEAIFYKSKALYGQRHFVKSLRHYMRAVKCDSSLRDVDYHKLLLKKSGEERDNFPKIKRSIYAGDEHFSRGEFSEALKFYEKALENPTRFKEKILYKLLNKKASSLFELGQYSEAYETFCESVEVSRNDYALFGAANSLYESHHGQINQERSRICDLLREASGISQAQLIKKAIIFKDMGEFEDCLESLDEFFSIHYRTDDDYIQALNLKLFIQKELGIDTLKTERILDSMSL
jgi:tetratricopeptide (TPR) repeat protein